MNMEEALAQKFKAESLKLETMCKEEMQKNLDWAFEHTVEQDIRNGLSDLAYDITEYPDDYDVLLNKATANAILSCENLAQELIKKYKNIDVDRTPDIKTTNGIVEMLRETEPVREQSFEDYDKTNSFDILADYLKENDGKYLLKYDVEMKVDAGFDVWYPNGSDIACEECFQTGIANVTTGDAEYDYYDDYDIIPEEGGSELHTRIHATLFADNLYTDNQKEAETLATNYFKDANLGDLSGDDVVNMEIYNVDKSLTDCLRFAAMVKGAAEQDSSYRQFTAINPDNNGMAYLASITSQGTVSIDIFESAQDAKTLLLPTFSDEALPAVNTYCNKNFYLGTIETTPSQIPAEMDKLLRESLHLTKETPEKTLKKEDNEYLK